MLNTNFNDFSMAPVSKKLKATHPTGGPKHTFKIPSSDKGKGKAVLKPKSNVRNGDVDDQMDVDDDDDEGVGSASDSESDDDNVSDKSTDTDTEIALSHMPQKSKQTLSTFSLTTYKQ